MMQFTYIMNLKKGVKTNPCWNEFNSEVQKSLKKWEICGRHFLEMGMYFHLTIVIYYIVVEKKKHCWWKFDETLFFCCALAKDISQMLKRWEIWYVLEIKIICSLSSQSSFFILSSQLCSLRKITSTSTRYGQTTKLEGEV